MRKLILIICYLVFATGVMAQDKNKKPKKCADFTSQFEGTVTDHKRLVISAATIYVYKETNNKKNKLTELNDENKVATISSDKMGQFKICLPAGTYQFLVSANGFKKT